MMEALTNALLPYLVQIAVSVIMLTVLPWALKHLKINLDDRQRAVVESALTNGVKYAIVAVARQRGITVGEVANNIIKTSENDIQDEVTVTAADYAKNAVPQSLAKLNVPTDQETLMKIVTPRVLEVSNKLL